VQGGNRAAGGQAGVAVARVGRITARARAGVGAGAGGLGREITWFNPARGACASISNYS
jgi:hypothetical protein